MSLACRRGISHSITDTMLYTTTQCPQYILLLCAKSPGFPGVAGFGEGKRGVNYFPTMHAATPPPSDNPHLFFMLQLVFLGYRTRTLLGPLTRDPGEDTPGGRRR